MKEREAKSNIVGSSLVTHGVLTVNQVRSEHDAISFVNLILCVLILEAVMRAARFSFLVVAGCSN